jgi:hypothetical protein
MRAQRLRARPRPIELRTRSRGIGDRGPGDRRADSHGGHGGGGGRASAMTSAQSKDVWTGKLNSVRWWVPSRILQFTCGYRGGTFGQHLRRYGPPVGTGHSASGYRQSAGG